MKHGLAQKLFLGKRFKYNPTLRNYSLSLSVRQALKRVEGKIASGRYRFEPAVCYCGEYNCIVLSQRDWFGIYYPFVICKRCGLMRANPRMTKEAYQDFYRDDYRALYGDNNRDKEQEYKIKVQQGQKVYDFIAGHIPLSLPAVVFDIGCNMGTMLLPFHRKGYEVMGVDYGVENVEFGRRKTGIPLEVGGVEKLKTFNKKADLVILNHVFEHFIDLEAESAVIRQMMKPDSFIFIALPGTFWWVQNICAGNIMGLLQNAHTYQFSLASLRYVMECCGYEFIWGNEEIKSIFRLKGVFRDKSNVPEGEWEKVLSYLEHRERNYLPKFYLGRLFEFMGVKEAVKRIIKNG